MKWYGYLGIFMLAFANINFFTKVEPFALFYIPIVWYGYIFLFDSVVYKIRHRSIISTYPWEFLLMLLISVPFWLISELYNLTAVDWIYIHWIWYEHLLDFTTILPAVAETFTLVKALGIFKNVRLHKISKGIMKPSIVLGVALMIIPIFVPKSAFPLIWIGIFLILDPINYLMGNASVFGKMTNGRWSEMFQLFLSGIIMGFFWEMWNYLSYAKWLYFLPSVFLPQYRLFEMPLIGYLGYLPFALDVFAFYTFFRIFRFKGENPLDKI